MVMQIWQAIMEWSEDKKRALSMLWGSHLRFFRQLVSRASWSALSPSGGPDAPQAVTAFCPVEHCRLITYCAWRCCSYRREAGVKHDGAHKHAFGAADRVQGGLH